MRSIYGVLAASAMSLGVSAAAAAGPNYDGHTSTSRRRVTRSRADGLPHGFLPANINRHTMKPHEHKREIARRLRHQEK